MPASTPIPPALLLALLLAAQACGPPAEPPPTRPAPPADAIRPPATLPAAPPTPFDAAPVVFDTTEPEAPVVHIPPRPRPTPPLPEPLRPPPAPASTLAGSCDVRGTESYCFAYTGTGWTRAAAEQHCSEAPASAFSAGACPSTDRVAVCTFQRPDDRAREIVYTYYAPYDVALAELACPGEFERVE